MIPASIVRRIANLVSPRVNSTCLTIDEWMDRITNKIEQTARGGGGSGGQSMPSVYRAEIAARLRAAGYKVYESADDATHLSIHWEDAL